MLRFEHPDFLWLLAALPALAVFFYGVHRWRKRSLSAFAAQAMLQELSPHMSTAKRTGKQVLVLFGLGFLVLAFANPQLGTRLEEVRREGIDLFVALDVSLSMKAEDIRPSRLEKAKRDVSALLNKLRGDRVGLIVFAGDAFVQFPLTSDYSAADLFISAVDVDAVPTPGTMIPTAIELALKSFSADLPTQKAIIIVSDGENTEGNIVSAVEKATSAGVTIFTVGMGTPEGGPIPIYNAAGSRVDYKRDRGGSIVLTKLEESTLQQISSATKGSYRRATSGGNEIDEVFKELSNLERVEFGVKQVTGFESMYQYPLAASILMFLFELLLSERRGSILSWLRRLVPLPAILCLALGMNLPAYAQTHRSLIGEGNEAFDGGKFPDAEAEYKKALQEYPDSKVGQFNLGDAYYKQQRYDEAQQAFATFASTGENAIDASKAFYNLGNTLYQAGKLEESIEAYKQTLRLNPTDEEARYNLELARKKKKEKEEEQKQENKDQQKKDQKKDKQDEQQKQDQQKKDQQQQQQDQQQQQQQPQPQTAQQNQMPKDQAERILEALRNSEKEIQKQIRKREGVRTKAEKDW
ncbi:MAG: tetratricopeptide repeat protein [Bacteroidota bacterium]